MKFVVRLLITAAVTYGLSMVLSPHIMIDSYLTALIFSLVLAFLNALIKPLLILLTLPLTILTLGIWLLILNVFMVMLAGKFVSGIHIGGFFWALIFAVLLSLLSSVLSKLERKVQ
jgi:putative membrane protein